MLTTRLRSLRAGSRRPFRTRARLLTAGAAGLVAVLGLSVGVALADPSSDEPRPLPPELAPPASEAEVVIFQATEPRVVIRSLRDPGSRVSASGRDLWEISELGSFDVPSAAMRAYKNAVAEVRRTTPACQLPWTLLAGIGRVESDHGRYGGSELGTDGLPRPAIVGIALDGKGPVAAIPDSDDGSWDGDTVWDRAVGPMQFIPGTWRSSGRDGDGDGDANPNDIDDAALAAAYYLCPSSGSILGESAMSAAIRSYNNSSYYVDLVLAFKRGYETGVFVIPSPPPAEGISADAPKVKPAVTKVGKNGKPVKKPGKGSGGKNGGGSGGTSGGGSGSGGTSTPKPTPTPTPKPTPTPTPTPTPQPETVTGELKACDGSYCVGARKVDWGPLAGSATHDFDGDGTTGSRADELAGLLEKAATVTVLLKAGTSVVEKLNTYAW